ncbi:class I SAM-dependent methyltransferase [Caldimonas brevitalea]|uniref:SAM-dependent methyltransferase n=1 Tax=Caldimonas brevitalea TaxID=413882 RepID=A0A0G3BM03_9BURK|nr:class I SAM-dependent methyltransferase [Caldimonas brevitalea]AKJ28386.1 SAM-dependent methyltransferase [Caldimonas brevitalea]
MTACNPHGTPAASPWVQRWSHLVAPGATVLDVACGSGRHTRWFASRGCRVTGVDRDAHAVAPLRELAEIVVADIEAGPWPLPGRRFDLVVVTHYLWRPLLPTLLDSVAPGGLLIYETFASGNETVGRPANPDFLLRPGELLEVCRDTLRVLGYEDGYLAAPPRFVQRITAVREHQRGLAGRYPLTQEPGPAHG